jgi:hypothetical protein
LYVVGGVSLVVFKANRMLTEAFDNMLYKVIGAVSIVAGAFMVALFAFWCLTKQPLSELPFGVALCVSGSHKQHAYNAP